MRLGSLLLSGIAVLGLVVATQACALLESTPSTKEDRLCTPGAYVFCRCADRAEGTKLCKQDGQSFEACQTSDTGECVGGEIDDPMTNQPVPPPDAGPDAQTPDDNPALTCPGKSQALTPNVDIVLEGDTSTATTDRKGKTGACAVGQGANDFVYHLIPSGTGSLEIQVQGSEGLDPLVYVRTTCDDENSQTGCAPNLPGKSVTLKTSVSTGKDYFLVIDGASGSTGKFSAVLKLTTGSFCGDGHVDPNEACDDGNHDDNDGCSPDCKKITGNPASGGSCPGHPVDVWSGQTVTGTGSTNGYPNTFTGPASSSCGLDIDGTNSAQDHVYLVTPHATGNLVVSVTAPPSGTFPDLMIEARRDCTTVDGNIGLCANDFSLGGGEALTVAVTKDQPIYIAVDGGGMTPNKGDYTVSFKLQ